MANVEIRWNPNWMDEVDLRPVLQELGRAVSGDARRYAPVRTGALRDSIQDEIVPDDNPFKVCLVVFSDEEHSIYVEMGTSKMVAQPYLRPAVEQRRDL